MATKGKEALNAEFEIVETKLVKSTPESKGVQLFSPDNKEQVIQAFVNAASLSFSATPAQCKKLVKESSKLTIKDKDDKEGYKKVYDKHREFVKVRTGTEKERKVLTDPFNQIKSGIDKVAKDEILSYTEKEEERLKSLVDQWKTWEQEEADRIEKEAKDALDARVKELEEAGLTFDGNFYSCGETISVDIRTIQDFTEESFLDFKNRVSIENEKIVEAKRISDLHNERRELALPFVAYWDEFEKTLNFGEVAKSDFNAFMERIQKAESDFKQKQKDQEAEAAKQIQDRKDLNYEKRSFKLEKEGFVIDENGRVHFTNEAGSINFKKEDLESLTDEWFNERFKKAIESKKVNEDEILKRKEEADKKIKDDAAAAIYNGRVEALLKEEFKNNKENGVFVYGLMNIREAAIKEYTDAEWVEVLVEVKNYKEKLEKETEKQKEEERLQKLPEIEKAVNYIDSVVRLEIPALKQAEINEILSTLKNDLKLATEKAIINLEKLK